MELAVNAPAVDIRSGQPARQSSKKIIHAQDRSNCCCLLFRSGGESNSPFLDEEKRGSRLPLRVDVLFGPILRDLAAETSSRRKPGRREAP
jgi:hypothetical protein